MTPDESFKFGGFFNKSAFSAASRFGLLCCIFACSPFLQSTSAIFRNLSSLFVSCPLVVVQLPADKSCVLFEIVLSRSVSIFSLSFVSSKARISSGIKCWSSHIIKVVFSSFPGKHVTLLLLRNRLHH